MQTMDHTNSGITELTDAQLDGIVGGSWLSAIGHAIVKAAKFVAGGFKSGGSSF